MISNLTSFRNKYQLSKTLRFELKPIGSDGKRLSEEESNQLFQNILEQDRNIKEAYDALKPVMDSVHEDIITKSLTSEEARSIDFSFYFEEYKKGKAKKLDTFEKELRENIGVIFKQTITSYKIIKTTKNKEEEKIVFEIKKNVPIAKAEIIDYLLEKNKDNIELKKHIQKFKGFFGYFEGYNSNRANYYEYTKEAKSSVATRIVHENLPKFCDNAILFEKRKEEYESALQYLKENNRNTQIKDAKTKKMIEAVAITEELFLINRFNNCLSQQGIDEYNRIIGHYNLLLNLYNQAKKSEKDFKKLNEFTILYKQIGCGTKRELFEQIKDEDELSKYIEKIVEAGKTHFEKQADESIPTVYKFTKWLKENDDWSGVYWSKSALGKISNQYLTNWHSIQTRIEDILKSKDKNDKEIKVVLNAVATYKKGREEELKFNDAIELSGLFSILNQTTEENWLESFFKTSVLEDRKELLNKNLSPSENLLLLICADIEDNAKAFNDESQKILGIADYTSDDSIKDIKNWLDKTKAILWGVQYFSVKRNKIKGESINTELDNLITEIHRSEEAEWFDWYDLVRNYLSKKPQDDAKKNKLKLNFENSSLLGGWSDGQEKIKGAVLLKKGNAYFVGILNQRNIFDTEKDNNPIYNASDSNVGKLILRSIAFKTVAGKGFVSKYNEKYSEIKTPSVAIKKLQEFIKENYVKKYPILKDVAEAQFSDKKVFDKAVQEALTECYECDFKPINWDVVLNAIATNKDNKKPELGKQLYLFEIYSKDFSENKGEKSKNSKVNLQTIYWEHLFDENSTIQLNGGGELFFRKKVDLKEEDKAVHSANEKINRRSDGKKESIFKHDIIKNKRFTENKFFFHVPIKVNYLAKTPVQAKINETVNENFTQFPDIQFLGIDRGEKHLIYYSLLNAKGEMISQGHFDTINNKDYLQAINDAAEIRKKKQENWQQKGNISNLKDGYISLVIHEIIQKMKDGDGNYKPTFIILEDLNTGFKRNRQKFEQQVYQKFELALAKKLNYLVDKNVKDINQIGSVANALQLTPAVSNYQDIENRKQVGIMLYTRANYTSVTDPATGWRKTIYLKSGSEADIKKQIVGTKEGKFEDGALSEIGFDGLDYFFIYTDKNTGKEWKLWSGKNGKSLKRYRFKRGNSKNESIIESIEVKPLLDKLFEKFDKSKSLKQQIENGIELQKVNEYTAWETLRFAIDIIQQIRNSGDTNNKQDDNFLLSPIGNEQGEHFDSRLFEKQENPKSPKDADANGAYNIARKGIIMYEHIKQLGEKWNRKVKIDGNDTIDLDLFVSDKEWDLWLTNRGEWKKNLKYFSSREAKSKTQ
ncbi:MAG TPA: type V CRISPR-associated protein Cas12a/Cpf1 [Niabella sp.]|nr:type V CRISPR-associated protein Cas12a/Cpf1 [Niabella sp.]